MGAGTKNTSFWKWVKSDVVIPRALPINSNNINLTLSVSRFFLIVAKWVYQAFGAIQVKFTIFNFFDIRVLRRSVLSVRVPECQKIKRGELDQYGSEHFEVLPFDTTGLERVNISTA